MTRLLIVEDDPAQARALARAFSKLRPDLTVLTAGNGLEATRLMSERPVDLLLTDLRMPEMDGFELVAWTVSHCPDAAVFTMSAYESEDAALRLNVLGAIDCFSKPLEPKAVLDRLADALEQSVHGHVQNVSLASFLQLMEMERKTCNLTIKSDDKSGLLVLHKGKLVDARSGDLQGEAAAISIIAWPNPSIMISRHSEVGPAVIQKSLGFMVMEAMRLHDEEAHNAPSQPDGNVSSWPERQLSWRPSPVPPSSSPVSVGKRLPPVPGLPSGATAIAMVDTATGVVLTSAVREGCPLAEVAQMAALVLRHQIATLNLWHAAEGVEELVVSTTGRCDVIRPLNGGGGSQFALLVFEPEETNLVMARLELDRFVAGHR
jgi:CheY-like chemotaxis protein